MDVNNLPYFLLREREEFDFNSHRLEWHQDCKALMLAQNQELRLANPSKAASLASLAAARPLVFDHYGQVCRIHVSDRHLEYNAGRGYLPLQDDDLRLVDALSGKFIDLAINREGRLAASYSDGASHGVLVFHLAKRWQAAVALPERPLRIWIDEQAVVWVLTATSLLRCAGEPLPHTYVPRIDRFEPLAINPHPLQVISRYGLRPADLPPAEQALALLDDNEQPLALCADKESLYLLAAGAGTSQTLTRLPLSANRLGIQRYLLEKAIPFAVDIGWVSPGRLALLPTQEAGDSH